jgi:glycine/D-amino acid oxidase-like deaminating enzyme
LARVDFLIAGQGLAGSLLAWELLRGGARVLVVDAADPSAASRIAAGLINPVTGRRLVLTPASGGQLSAGLRSYARLEHALGERLYRPLPLLRLFRRPAERAQWQRRLGEPGYRDYLEPLGCAAPPGLRAPYGVGVQRHTGQLDIPTLLGRMRAWLQARDAWRRGRIHPAAVEFGPSAVRWGEVSAGRLIFCQGWEARQHPWFSRLPWQPVKGEILDLRLRAPALEPWILNAGHWLLPRGDGRFRLGASYDRERPDTQPSASARQRLLEALGQLLDPLPRFSVEGHRAGVRPATGDKQPFLGLHPLQPRLGICNGFGSKGSLTIPFYAERLAAHLLSGVPLPPEADIRRYAELVT